MGEKPNFVLNEGRLLKVTPSYKVYQLENKGNSHSFEIIKKHNFFPHVEKYVFYGQKIIFSKDEIYII